ncbi:MAG: ABC transporter ATP-binding protein [Deltaproteobacteria bacterium]|nr:MAG: ABC transporter ATP-binding protein [Deltaproteobacteria bacterium]
MIDIKGLTKRYGEVTAIDNVCFCLEKGEILGLLGPNGAGKTTTMRIISGFMPPSSGTATVAGYDVLEEPREVKKRVGYMPEHPPLYNEMTVGSYLDFVARIKGVPRNQKRSSFERVIEQCGLQKVTGRLIGNLSKGYRQRLGLAQALIHNPEVLILDEPTIGLDPVQIIEIRELVKTLGDEHTIILSSHILPEITMICERVVIINEGKVVVVDSYEGLSARLKDSEKIAITVTRPNDQVIPRLKELTGVKEIFADEGNPNCFVIDSEVKSKIGEEVAKMIVNEGWGLQEMKLMSLTLEDIYLRLITGKKEILS